MVSSASLPNAAQDDETRELALASNAWPFVEARKLLERQARRREGDRPIIFETGYGPSGLPHIGTFGEVVRTSMVRHAFSILSDTPTRLIVFSDDLDGLRAVPENVPASDAWAAHLGKPLTAIPDPFGTHSSFGAHNNSRLRAFLDRFGFDYEFVSATETYRAGTFDPYLLLVLEKYDEVVDVILPTLGPERRATYSPFLPISATTGTVLQVPVLEIDAARGAIAYKGEDGRAVETSVTGGRCKLQWKVDWAMRWVAMGIDYEMAGKDLIDSVTLSTRLCRILGGDPPETLIYELFLDEKGQKISKKKGNGLTVDEWLRYAPPESLSLFMYQKPKSAKRLYFDVIPRCADEYLSLLSSYKTQEVANQLNNPVWHIHAGKPPAEDIFLNYSLILNLASVCHAEDEKVLWGYIDRYFSDLSASQSHLLSSLVSSAVNYYHDFVKPFKQYRQPSESERAALADLARTLDSLPDEVDAETIQHVVFEVGKRHNCFPALKAWFQMLYETLLGQRSGPRMGSFIALYGKAETSRLIQRVIDGEDIRENRARAK